MISLHCQQ